LPFHLASSSYTQIDSKFSVWLRLTENFLRPHRLAILALQVALDIKKIAPLPFLIPKF